jgi:ribonuclease HI
MEPENVRRQLSALAGDSAAAAPSVVKEGAAETATPGSIGLHLYTDGASRGNPGPAGAGVAIFDENGQEVLAKGAYLGMCTNNVAEYTALKLGLKEAMRFGVKRLRVHLDSELIVRQLHGIYKVKDAKLQPLYQEVVAMLRTFPEANVVHVRREKNRRADELANQGLDAGLAKN